MRSITLLLGAAALCPGPLSAQRNIVAEIGTSTGVTISIPDGGDAEVDVSLPGAGSFAGLPTLYATIFPTKSWMIEPQVFFSWSSAVDEVTFSATLQLGYLFTPLARGSFYLAANGSYFNLGTSGTVFDINSPAVGGAVGYRRVLKDSFVVRFEGGVRRWLDFDLNEVITGIRLALLVP